MKEVLKKITSGRWLISLSLTHYIGQMLLRGMEIPEWLILTYTGTIVLYYFRPDRKSDEEVVP